MNIGDTAVFDVACDSVPTGSGAKTIGIGVGTFIGGFMVINSAATPLTFNTNSGSAVETSNAITVSGGNIITTTGAANTVTVRATNGTNGQVPIGGGANPIWANITAGSGISVTNAANSITIAATGGFSANSFFAYAVGVTPSFFTANNTYKTIPFTQTLFNNGGHFNTTTYKWTCPTTGLYYFTSNVLIGVSVTNYSFGKSLRFNSSGSPMCYCNYPPANTNGTTAALSPYVGLSHGIFVPMTAGVTLEVQVEVSDITGLALIGYNSFTDSQYTWFAGYRVG
jgi:hypothetical protein